MGFTIYRSNGLHGITDVNAPVLSGTNSSFINLLNACLVNGWTGKSPAGWTKPFTGTNKAVFKSASSATAYYRVNDDGAHPDGTGSGQPYRAYIVGYESMSDVDTGTGLFPTAAQAISDGNSGGGVCFRKSVTNDATAREWIVLADSKTCYVFSKSGDASTTWPAACCMGEFYSFISQDSYRNIITGAVDGSVDARLANFVSSSGASVILGQQVCKYLPRGHTQLGGSVRIGIHGNHCLGGSSSSQGNYGVVPFTNPSNGGIFLAPIWITDPTTVPITSLRGRMRGYWHWCHSITGIVDGDTFNGTGELAGKSFLCLKTFASDGGVGSAVVIMETSDTLETN